MCGVVGISIHKLKPSIAIIDDDIFCLKNIEKIVKKSFPTTPVVLFDSADLAIKEIIKNKPNIVITDIELPGKKGDVLLRELNALELGIQTIVMTSSESITLIASCFRSGASSYLSKSAPPSKIIAALAHCINNLMFWEKLMKEVIDGNAKYNKT